MNKKDYKKYYIEGSDHYLIPRDVFEELLDGIDKTIEYINSYDDGCYSDNTLKNKIAELNITELLKILKGE